MTAGSLTEKLAHTIERSGPIPVSAYVAAALYDDAFGFYTAGVGRAGRGGDFLTSPEVGPLFGAVVARAVDRWWADAGSPPTFVVEEWGAGPGTLARSVVAADPACLRAGALRWVQVEVSPTQRALHLDHPALVSVAPLDAESTPDLVVANELLDNLPFEIAERDADGWKELRIAAPDRHGRFAAVLGPAVASPPGADALPVGSRVPRATDATRWVGDAIDRARSGVIVVDYGAPTCELARRGDGWLRTHVAHDDAGDWLVEPGTCDITADVPFDQLPDGATITSQADWLRSHGIDALVEAGRQAWAAGAARGDLAALRGRSRVREAEALLDPSGLGAFTVLEWGR